MPQEHELQWSEKNVTHTWEQIGILAVTTGTSTIASY